MFKADNQRVQHIGNLPARSAVDGISYSVIEVLYVLCWLLLLSGNGIRVVADYLMTRITGCLIVI